MQEQPLLESLQRAQLAVRQLLEELLQAQRAEFVSDPRQMLSILQGIGVASIRPFTFSESVAAAGTATFTLDTNPGQVAVMLEMHVEVSTPFTSAMVMTRDGSRAILDSRVSNRDIPLESWNPFHNDWIVTFTNNDLIDVFYKWWGLSATVEEDTWTRIGGLLRGAIGV